MQISLLTPDSKLPNLAIMKISQYHKQRGDEVLLNMPLFPADLTYVSVLFDWTKYKHLITTKKYIVGGPGTDPSIKLDKEIEACKPDYSLYPDIDYSIGYTYRACHRGCDFCKVPLMNESKDHKSIWEFHDKKFKKIALLNNNTFEDVGWLKTFEEIWEAGLTLKDVSGFDARLFTEEKAEALAKTKIEGQIHIAFDHIDDEPYVRRAINLIRQAGIHPRKITAYVLIGYDSTHKENLYRIEVLKELKAESFVMPFDKKDPYQKSFARWCNHKAVFKTTSFEDYGKVAKKPDSRQKELI